MNPSDRPILSAIEDEFRKLKRAAERCFEQLADEDLFWRLNADANSPWVIVKHLSGNMVSRWTDFLSSDGEKPDRDRDGEFVEDVVPRGEVMERWERGWACALAGLAGLGDADLGRVVTVRGEPHTVFQAINRQTSHYAYHVGQIVLLAKHICLAVRGREWKYLTIPRGQSRQFNQQVARQPAKPSI